MIVYTDAKALELRTKAELTRDQVLINEIINKVDLHSTNQAEFVLPDRLTAKKLNFRLIYGGSAYAYSIDPDFLHLGYDQDRWQEIIDAFFTKYHGIADAHTAWWRYVLRTGKMSIPTGREYHFQKYPTNDGALIYNKNQVYNNPNQGFAAEIVCLYRILLRDRLQLNFKRDYKFITTVHDMNSLDVPKEVVPEVASIMLDTYSLIIPAFEELFKYKLVVPYEGDIKVGPTFGELEEYDG